MNFKDFSQKVRAGGRGQLSKEYLGPIIDSYGGRDDYYDKDVSFAIQIAARLQASVPNEKNQVIVPPGPRESMDSDLICDAMEPKVREIRKQFFGSEDPPFPGSKESPLAGASKIGEWLKARAVRPASRPPAGEGQIDRLTNELLVLTGMEITRSHPMIHYPSQDTVTLEWQSAWIVVPTDSPIHGLAREIKRMVACGFSETALTAWIFTGVRPIVPRISVCFGFSWAEGMSAERYYSEITIARDVTWDELWKVYRLIKKKGRLDQRKLNPLHEHICQLVGEGGGPPSGHGTKTVFWKSIQQKLKKDKRFKDEIPGTWEAVRKAYMTVVKKAGPNYKEQIPAKIGKGAKSRHLKKASA